MNNINLPRPVWWIIWFVLLFVLILIVHALHGFELRISWFHMGITG